jgi:hypothetical protein
VTQAWEEDVEALTATMQAKAQETAAMLASEEARLAERWDVANAQWLEDRRALEQQLSQWVEAKAQWQDERTSLLAHTVQLQAQLDATAVEATTV